MLAGSSFYQSQQQQSSLEQQQQQQKEQLAMATTGGRHSYPFTTPAQSSGFPFQQQSQQQPLDYLNQQQQQPIQQQLVQGQTQSPQYVKSYFSSAPPAQQQQQQQQQPQVQQQQMFPPPQQSQTPFGQRFPQQQLQQQQQQQPRNEIASIYDVYSNAPSTPQHQQQQMQNYTPMSVSPTTPQMYNLNMQRSPMTPGGSARTPQKLDQRYPRTVTVFGFQPEASAYILSLFRNFGEVRSYKFVGNTNWMNIEYADEVQAQMALSKNGMQVDDVMIGCVPMRASHEDSQAYGGSVVSGTGVSAATGGRAGGLGQSLGALTSPMRSGHLLSVRPAPPTQRQQMVETPMVNRQRPTQPPTMNLSSAMNSATSPYSSATVSDLNQQQSSDVTLGKPGSVIGTWMERLMGW